MRNLIENTIIALALLLFLSINGCGVSQYTATTKSWYELPNGEKLGYESNKNQENFKADLGLSPNGQLRTLHVETTASTPEAAIAAALQSNLEVSKQISALIQTILPLIQNAAKVAATTGS